MSARILVVDDIQTNVMLLEERLKAEYFEVLTASNGQKALDVVASMQVDLILLDIMMPGIDGFETCARLKQDPRSEHIPIILVTALDQPSDCIKGLQAGADDFLTKPINDFQLITRVKNLLRLKVLTDELRMRSETARAIGGRLGVPEDTATYEARASILFVEQNVSVQETVARALEPIADTMPLSDPRAAIFETAERPYDIVLIGSRFVDVDPLRLCSQIRSLERTRYIPIIYLAEPDDHGRVLRALEIGVNDYAFRPLELNELIARCRTQIRKKRYDDQLRASLHQTLELVITDALTGLHNRRYLDGHLPNLVKHAINQERPLSVVMADIDRFKAINDRYGHAAGDEVLREFAYRIRTCMRGTDLACRYGGEEFVIIMPDTDIQTAAAVAERFRRSIEVKPFTIAAHKQHIQVTASMGLAALSNIHETTEVLLRRADIALYKAKVNGRNQVASEAA